MKGLVAESSPVLRRAEANVLRSLEFDEIVEAADFLEAVTAIEEGGFGLVVIDGQIEGGDGFEIVARLRRSRELKDVPVVMVSSARRKEAIVAALKAGVNSYVLKPFKPEVLRDRVRGALRGADAARAVLPGKPEEQAFSGTFEVMAVPEVIQFIALSVKTGVLHAECAGGKRTYEIGFDKGRIMHTVGGGLTGEAAAYRLMLEDSGRFHFDEKEVEAGRNVGASTTQILLEGARIRERRYDG